MSSVNKVILIGNVGQDPEIKHLESGMAVAKLSIATTETYTVKSTGEKKKETEWHNLEFWGKIVDSVIDKYVKKGNRIYVEGKIKTDKWEDKEGNTKYSTKIKCDSLTLLGSLSSQTSEAVSEDTEANTNEGSDDSLPF